MRRESEGSWGWVRGARWVSEAWKVHQGSSGTLHNGMQRETTRRPKAGGEVAWLQCLMTQRNAWASEGDAQPKDCLGGRNTSLTHTYSDRHV